MSVVRDVEWSPVCIGMDGHAKVLSRGEVRELDVPGILPVIAPPEWPWPDIGGGVVPDIGATIAGMMMVAHRWGVPLGSPLALDLTDIGDDIAAPQVNAAHGYLPQVRESWKHWCYGRFAPWLIGHRPVMQDVPTQRCMLREPGEVPLYYTATETHALSGQTWMRSDLDGLIVL